MSATNYLAGLAAEDQVVDHYARRAHTLAARRWRGTGGEIDVVMRHADTIVFVEVKRARSCASARYRLTRRQMDRIVAAGSEFLAGEPMGQLTDVRFDLAVVDGQGHIEIIENAFAENW